jgi:hypothetical protein
MDSRLAARAAPRNDNVVRCLIRDPDGTIRQRHNTKLERHRKAQDRPTPGIDLHIIHPAAKLLSEPFDEP